MAILNVFEYPHPALGQKAEKVEKVDAEIRKLLDDMLETIYSSHDETSRSVGLAGNQVGILKRLVVIDVGGEGKKQNPIKMVNPEIIKRSAAVLCQMEGCMSVPKQYAPIDRFETVTVRYTDENGQVKEISADGLLSVALQHELDHLDGVLFIDYLSTLKRNMLIRKLEKRRKREY